MSCDVRITTSDAASSFSLEDEVNGYTLLNEISEPEWDEMSPRVTSPYMHGDVGTAPPTLAPGFLPVIVEVSGDSWAQVSTRTAALETAWRAETQFLLDVELEGVVTRYRAERSAWRPAPVTAESVFHNVREVSLIFRVQPFPLTL